MHINALRAKCSPAMLLYEDLLSDDTVAGHKQELHWVQTGPLMLFHPLHRFLVYPATVAQESSYSSVLQLTSICQMVHPCQGAT